MSSDQEKRLPGCQGRQQHRFQPFPAKQAERAGQQRTDFAVFDRWIGGGTGLGGFGGSFTGAHWVCGLRITHQEHKKIRRPSSGGGKFRGDFSFRRSLSRTSTLAGQGTLPSPTAGCRIRFPESLLMLRLTSKPAKALCQFAQPDATRMRLTPLCLRRGSELLRSDLAARKG